MARASILAVALAATWLVWSGLFKPLLLGLGVLSLVIVLWLARRMALTDRDVFALDLLPRLGGFSLWLLREVVKSNLTVARIVLSPRMPISPTTVCLDVPVRGLIGQATLANSITLTPGTLTVDAHDGRFQVHCLTEQGARELEQGEMARRVERALGDH